MAKQDEQKKALNDLIAKAQDAIDKGDLETARSLKADIDKQKQEYEELQSLQEEINAAAPKDDGEPEKTDEPEVQDNKPEDGAPADDEEQPADDPTEEDDGKDKKKKKGAKRSMPKLESQETNQAVIGFEEYMRSKGAKRDNVVSDDVGVTIPEDIQYQPEKEVKTVQDLSELVQKTSVNTASGKYPILKRANTKFHTVDELEANPELAKPQFETIKWEVATYRGAIPISQEALDDSVANLTSIVQENIQEQKINTLNEEIGEVLKTFNPQAVNNVDDLKAITNVKLDPGYDRQIIATQSFYQKLDTLKDGNGRYLLQDAITNVAGNTVLGMPITVVRDDLLGKNGDALAFIGDVKRAVLFADRTDVSVQWIENNVYGKYLMGAFRFDVEKADANAGFFVTFGENAGGGDDTEEPTP